MESLQKFKDSAASITLVRPNELLELIPHEPGYKITATHRKVWAVLALIGNHQPDKEIHEAFLSDIQELADCKKMNWAGFKKLVSDLAIPLDWIYHTNEKGQEVQSLVSPIQNVELIHGKQGVPVVLRWGFHTSIRCRLINPINFWTKQYLKQITKLRLGASIALYDVACKYLTNNNKLKTDKKPLGWGTTGYRPFEEWINVILGEKRTKPYEWSAFNRDILQPALKELNSEEEPTNILIRMNTESRGGTRKITHLEFVITERVPSVSNQDQSLLPSQEHKTPFLPKLELEEKLILFLNNQNISKENIFQLIEKYSVDHVSFQIRQLEKKMTSGVRIAKPLPYLIAALKDNYIDSDHVQPQKYVPGQISTSIETPEPQTPPEWIEALKRFSEFSLKEQQEFLQRFYVEIENSVMKGIFRKIIHQQDLSPLEKLQNKMMKGNFLIWFIKHLKNVTQSDSDTQNDHVNRSEIGKI